MANDFYTLPAGTWEDGVTVSGTNLRRGQSVALVGGSTGLAVRGGVRPSRGNPLGVTLPGGMFARVQPGTVAVPGPAGEGAYIVTLPAQQDLAVTAANGSNPRIDLVGVEVVPGSPTTWRLRMLDGTPNASPVAPTYAVAGGYFLPVYQVRVNASVTVPTSVTDIRTYAVAPGATVPIPGFAALSTSAQNAICAGLPEGTGIFDPAVNVYGLVTSAGTFYRIRQAPFRVRVNDEFASPGVTGGSVIGPSATYVGSTVSVPAHEAGSTIDAHVQVTARVAGQAAQTIRVYPSTTGAGLTKITADLLPERIDYVDADFVGAEWRIHHSETSFTSSGAACTFAAAALIGTGAPNVVIQSAQCFVTVWP